MRSVFLIFLVSAAALADTEHLSLEKSVALALKNSTPVIRSADEAQLAGTRLLQGYGQFLPNLDTTATLAYVSGRNYFTQAAPTVVDTRNYGLTTQISTTLNLFNGLGDFSALKSAIHQRNAADLSLDRAKQDVATDVTQSYLQVILEQHLIEIADQNLKASKDRERRLRGQTEVGMKNKSDLFRQTALTATDESYLIDRQNRLRTAINGLLQRLRLDPAKDYVFDAPTLDEKIAKEELPAEAKMVETALSSRPDLQASNDRAEAADWNVGRARAEYYPKIDLNLSVFSNGRTINYLNVNGNTATPPVQDPLLPQLGNHTYYVAGLTLTWGIFDRFLTTLKVEQAKVDANNRHLDADDLRLRVAAQIRQVYGDFRGAVQQLETSRRGLEAANLAYETISAKYQIGSANFVDLSTAQSDLVRAQSARIQAQINLVLQRRLVDYYRGIM